MFRKHFYFLAFYLLFLWTYINLDLLKICKGKKSEKVYFNWINNAYSLLQ